MSASGMSASTEGSSSARPGAAALGCVIAALGLALVVIPAAGPQATWTIWVYLAGAAALMIGTTIVASDIRRSIASAASLSKDDQRRFFGQYLFDRHATALAFFFMVVVLLVSVVTTMMLYNGQLAVTARDFAAQLSTSATPSPSGKGKVLGIVLVLSISLSWCGAGLYVVQRLEAKRNDPNEFFNFLEFFRGIWSRVGQANLYTLLFFLLIWANGEAIGSERVPGGTNTAVAWDIVKSYAWLPILGLLSGLLVKSAESVVFGLGCRLLAAVSAFLGSENTGGHGPSTKSTRDATGTPPKGASGDDHGAPTHARGTPSDAHATKSTGAAEPPKTAPVNTSESAPKPTNATLLSPPPAAAAPAATPTATPTPKPNGTHANGSTHAPTPPAAPTPSVIPQNVRRESPASPFASAFSVPTTVPAPSATGSMSVGPSNANGHSSPSAPVRVVPVTMPAPATIDVRPTIVPISAPTTTSVMVNVERPEVPTLQDVVGPASNARPQSSTTGIPQSSLWPALIRVVAPSRMTPNEPKILLPDLPEGD